MSEKQTYQIIEDVVYFGKGEPFWKLDLALPVDAGDELRPAVLLVHGGGFNACTKGESSKVTCCGSWPAMAMWPPGWNIVSVRSPLSPASLPM